MARLSPELVERAPLHESGDARLAVEIRHAFVATEPMDAPETLLESVSPNGNVCAFVEQDGRVGHFYLRGDDKERFGLKSCWVRNLGPAPEQLDVAGMRAGVPPLLPRAYCAHPQGATPLAREKLTVIWSEEGDAAALCEDGESLAIIPTWSGEKGFDGYARDCVAQSPLCWPLTTPGNRALLERYERAAVYWREWSSETVWVPFQERMCELLERQVGPRSNYYAIDGGQWPPKALLRVPSREQVRLLTLGVALRPMPKVEMHYDDPAPYRRIELATSLPASLDENGVRRVAAYISGQTTLPWDHHTFLGDGHTLPADAFAELSGGRLPFALLQARPAGVPDLSVPSFRGDPITYLWLTPIGAREQRFAEEHGSAAIADKLCAARFDAAQIFARAELRV